VQIVPFGRKGDNHSDDHSAIQIGGSRSPTVVMSGKHFG
jgi:hypothetical protein